MRATTPAETLILKTLLKVVPKVKALTKRGVETIVIIEGDYATGKTTAGMLTTKKYPYAYYADLGAYDLNSKAKLTKILVRAAGRTPLWTEVDNIEILKELSDSVFIIDHAEDLLNLRGKKHSPTPPLLKLIKHLTEWGIGVVLIANKSFSAEVFKYPEVWKRVEEVIELPALSEEDLRAFEKTYKVKLVQPAKVLDYCIQNGLTAIDLDKVFSKLARNGIFEVDLATFKTVFEGVETSKFVAVRNLATA